MTSQVLETLGRPLPAQGDKPAYWSGIFAMTLCVFVLIASEFMPVSLLTPMASELHVSEGLAGYGIAICGAFLCLVPMALIALAWQWISLPSMKPGPSVAGSRNVFSLFKNRSIAWGMLAVGAFFMGQFVLFTYVRPFLETVTRVHVATLSMILLVIGVGGLFGTTIIGSFLKSGMYRTLVAVPLIMAAIALALTCLG